jgi:hypothetical protein
MESGRSALWAKLRKTASRLNPLPDSARPLFRPSSAELILWILFVSVTLAMAWHHEPWRDEAQGYVVVRDNTLVGLILHMKVESQFLLWYLFTWPFVRLFGMSIFGVALMHWALSCSTAYLIVRRAPFRFLTRAALIFGVLFAFEFTVVVRHYAIGVFLLTVLMLNWRERFRRPVLYACGIALCASTNLPVWACLGGLCCAIGYEVIARRLWSRRIFASMLICVFGFALALGSIYNGYGFGSPYVGKRGGELAEMGIPERLRDALEFISVTTFMPLCGRDKFPDSVLAGLSLACIVCIALGLLHFARKSIPAFVCFLTSVVLVVSLQLVGGFHSMRHIGFILVGTVVAAWIAACDDKTVSGGQSGLQKRAFRVLARIAGSVVALILLVHVLITSVFVWGEITRPFSHGYATAQFIRRVVPEDVPMYCFSARSNVSVLPWLPRRQFFIFDRMEYGTFSKWGRSFGQSLKDMADEVVARLKPDQQCAIFVVAMNEFPNFFPPNTIVLYDSRKSELPVWGPYVEEFVVLAVVRHEDVERYRSAFPRKQSPLMQGF